MNNNSSFIDRLNKWFRESITVKLFVIGILILVLLIPARMVEDLIIERESLRDTAIADISSKWGGMQLIGGPVLTVPYTIAVKNERNEIENLIQYAHFLPKTLNIKGQLFPEKRYRGIYVVVLYNAKLKLEGEFGDFNLQALNIPAQSLQWNKAFISVGISDMKGIKDNILLSWNNDKKMFGPGIPTADIFQSGVSTLVPSVDTGTKYRFSFELNLNGSERLHFLPFGEETNVSLTGNWSDPSFEGAYLPEKKNIGTKDFSAEWKVLQLNRNYPQQGTGNFLPPIEISFETEPVNFIPNQNRGIGSAGSFGVKLLVPIDEYQKTNRSAKYAVMFIFLTFLTLFFTEILSRRLIHPIQYLLIGFGIVLFYVLLLSISEHIKFGWAYLIASAAITLLITYYAWNMLRQRFLTAVVGGVVLVLYVFYYSLLQLEQYALLLGSIGLLVILATVMYLTRNINWYDLYSNNDKSDK